MSIQMSWMIESHLRKFNSQPTIIFTNKLNRVSSKKIIIKPMIKKYLTPFSSINLSSCLNLSLFWTPKNADNTLCIMRKIFINSIVAF